MSRKEELCNRCADKYEGQLKDLRSQLSAAEERLARYQEFPCGHVAIADEIAPGERVTWIGCPICAMKEGTVEHIGELENKLSAATEEKERLRGALEKAYRFIEVQPTIGAAWGINKSNILVECSAALAPSPASGLLEQVEKALELTQWGNSEDIGTIRLCPVCDQTEKRGHAPDCPVGTALSSLRSATGRQKDKD
jgi:hypothetical protein